MGSAAAASQGGVNEEPSLEGTGVEAVTSTDSMRSEYQKTPSGGERFDFYVWINEEQEGNVTSQGVVLVTQVCINSGICHPPETQELRRGDGMDFNWSGDLWWGHIVPEDTVTYVNWKIEIQWDDGNTTSIPENGFGWKAWSDCWYDNGSWGGESTECQEDGSPSIPGFATPLAIASISMAALMVRRE